MLVEIRLICVLALVGIGFNPVFAQGLVMEGNSISARGFNTDNDPTNFDFVVDFPITQSGTLQEVLTWGQNSGVGIPGIGESFIFYVLRPVGTNFQVMLKTDYMTVTNVGMNTFAAPAFSLKVGDLISHYGRGIPLDNHTGGPSSIYENQASSIPAPNVGDILELPGPVYPLYSDGGRDYAIAVGVSPLPSLSIAYVDNSLIISWAGPTTNTLLQTTNLDSGLWTTNSSFISAGGTNTLTITAPAGNLFFRLRIP